VESSGPSRIPIYEPPHDLRNKDLRDKDLRDQDLQDQDLRGHESEPDEDNSLTRLWLLWRERRLFLNVAWKTAVLSAIIAVLLPVHYEGVVKIVPGESSGGSAGMSGLLGKLMGGGGSGGGMGLGLDAAGLLGMKTPGAFYIEVLKSRSLQDRMIDRFDLRHHYWKFSRWYTHDYYTTRKRLKDFTDIEEDKKSAVITLSVTDYDPNVAAQMANVYVEELNKAAADLNTGDAHRERVFLEGRLTEAKQDLDDASRALSQYSSKNTLMDPQTQGKAMVDAAARVQGEIVATEAELKGLQQIYSDDNTRVRTLKARLGVLQSQIKSMQGKGTAAGTSEGDSISGFPSMTQLPVLGYTYYDLYRQAKIRETVYEFLTQQYELAKVQEAKELPSVRVMDPAIKPERKSSPKRTLIVVLSVLGAWVLAVFFVLGRNKWDQRPPNDSLRMLGAEVADEGRRLTGWFRRKSD
jgi:capsule polysaccharide export protein KpsE/RkpR